MAISYMAWMDYLEGRGPSPRGPAPEFVRRVSAELPIAEARATALAEAKGDGSHSPTLDSLRTPFKDWVDHIEGRRTKPDGPTPDFVRRYYAEAIVAEAKGNAPKWATQILAEGDESEGGTRTMKRTVSVGLEEADVGTAALTGFFLDQDVVVEGERIPRYRSIREAYIDLTGDKRVSGRVSEADGEGKWNISDANGGLFRHRRLVEAEDGAYMLAEAISTSTFDQALGDSVTRAMVREYRRSNLIAAVNLLADVVPVRDFRTQRRVRVGGYGNLPTVNQAATYNALTSPTDEEATYAATKRGGVETITLEAIANDDISSIRRIPQRLARSAAQTLHEFVFAFIDPAVNAAIYDSVALYHATHSNIGTSALSVASLVAARMRMRKQAELGSSKRLGLIGRHLWIAPELEQTAFEITASDRKPYVADNEANFIRDAGIDYTVIDYWTDTNNWVLSADKADVPTVEIGYYGPSEEPELFTQDNPNAGSMFDSDQLKYKIRHIYGGAVVEYRGLDGSVVP